MKYDKIRLSGSKLSELNKRIHERDAHICILCGRSVLPGEKFHHYPQGADKNDREECGVLLCMSCHHDAHHSGRVKEIKEKVAAYLERLYGGVEGG